MLGRSRVVKQSPSYGVFMEGPAPPERTLTSAELEPAALRTEGVEETMAPTADTLNKVSDPQPNSELQDMQTPIIRSSIHLSTANLPFSDPCLSGITWPLAIYVTVARNFGLPLTGGGKRRRARCALQMALGELAMMACNVYARRA
ncbi:hypothetical protein MRX96_057245 [Rhipicephalus microplus]